MVKAALAFPRLDPAINLDLKSGALLSERQEHLPVEIQKSFHDSMTLISTAEYSLRLVAPDGVPHVGRLDVWYGEEWRPVCAGRWGREEVTVACRQLGYEELVAFNNSKFLIASFPGSFPHSRHKKEGVRLISQVLACY